MATQTVQDYDYFTGTLTIYVQTQRPASAAPTVLVSAPIHEEYAARVRSCLREYKNAVAPYLPAYGSPALPIYAIRKLTPAGSSRAVDAEFWQDILALRFSLEFAVQPTIGEEVDELLVLAFERNIEKAIFDLFAAQSIPNATIPGTDEGLGPSWIDIRFELGPAQNLGIVQVPV